MCAALARGEPESFPVAPAARRPVKVLGVAALVVREGRVLLVRRSPGDALLAGFWEIPWVETRGSDAAEALGERYGGTWRLGERLGRVRHGITWRALEIEVRAAELGDGEVCESSEAGWFTDGEIEGLPTSSLIGKILRLG